MKAKFKALDSTEKLEDLFEKSSKNPIVLFKHSDTCSISLGVFEEISNADVEINIVVVQQNRDISNSIAEMTGIRHQSPQAIVLKNGRPVYNASHYDITADAVKEACS